MQLTNQQKLDFHENGYLKIPRTVSALMINAALHSANFSLGGEGMNKDDLSTLPAQSTVKRYGIHLPLQIWQTNQLQSR